jgi:predicted GIY-YIG superfamily endonuclease
MERTYCVYTMSNVAKMLYAGVTNNLEERVFQHKSKQTAGCHEIQFIQTGLL